MGLVGIGTCGAQGQDRSEIGQVLCEACGDFGEVVVGLGLGGGRGMCTFTYSNKDIHCYYA